MLNFSVDYLFSSAGKLQFYVEVVAYINEKRDKPFYDLSLSVPEAGLEPAQPQWPKDFKSFVSTIPPSGLNS